MRLRGYYISMVLIAVNLSGCGVIPNFPDLWPFDYEPNRQVVSAQAQGAQPSEDAPAQPASEDGGPTPSAPGAVLYIVSPADGAVLTNPVRVVFGLDRMGVAPATLDQDFVGHHHLLVDTDLPPLDQAIPIDENHLHFSGGQTETTLNLPLGEHTLQLLLGDNNHVPHQPPLYSRPITIVVQ